MMNPMLKRLYRSIPFAIACELHKRIKSGCTSPETRAMLRNAMQQAKIGRSMA